MREGREERNVERGGERTEDEQGRREERRAEAEEGCEGLPARAEGERRGMKRRRGSEEANVKEEDRERRRRISERGEQQRWVREVGAREEGGWQERKREDRDGEE
ncbi:hypothetical protein NHX12_009343 [Muraenolepis orangiensis]|uniref:Uncharacterized protein n=1 Tax=Muraenolepis orangiensis TaxID=630683 RepID=A0A9Q0DN67_9TELE|nr:hypothetical protein NHX12_009343 [Muraenolepis orangiensis]